MKKKTGVFIIVFLTVMVMGGLQPAMLYSGQSGQGNLWDFLIDPGPATGMKWSGPLSIYYKFTEINCGPGYNPQATLYFTVRLGHQGIAPYAYYGVSDGPICRDDIDPTQGNALRSFLNDALSEIYGTPKIWENGDWKLKSIQNATYWFDRDIGVDGTFVADIQVAVKE